MYICTSGGDHYSTSREALNRRLTEGKPNFIHGLRELLDDHEVATSATDPKLVSRKYLYLQDIHTVLAKFLDPKNPDSIGNICRDFNDLCGKAVLNGDVGMLDMTENSMRENLENPHSLNGAIADEAGFLQQASRNNNAVEFDREIKRIKLTEEKKREEKDTIERGKMAEQQTRAETAKADAEKAKADAEKANGNEQVRAEKAKADLAEFLLQKEKASVTTSAPSAAPSAPSVAPRQPPVVPPQPVVAAVEDEYDDEILSVHDEMVAESAAAPALASAPAPALAPAPAPALAPASAPQIVSSTIATITETEWGRPRNQTISGVTMNNVSKITPFKTYPLSLKTRNGSMDVGGIVVNDKKYYCIRDVTTRCEDSRANHTAKIGRANLFRERYQHKEGCIIIMQGKGTRAFMTEDLIIQAARNSKNKFPQFFRTFL